MKESFGVSLSCAHESDISGADSSECYIYGTDEKACKLYDRFNTGSETT